MGQNRAELGGTKQGPSWLVAEDTIYCWETQRHMWCIWVAYPRATINHNPEQCSCRFTTARSPQARQADHCLVHQGSQAGGCCAGRGIIAQRHSRHAAAGRNGSCHIRAAQFARRTKGPHLHRGCRSSRGRGAASCKPA